MPASGSFTIRRGYENDCEAVLTILQATFGVYGGQLDPPSGVTRETVDTLREKAARETLWLAEVQAESVAVSRCIAGCIFAAPHPQDPQDLYFGRLGVLPAYQRQSIARRLVAKVEQQAREEGFSRVVLAVRMALPQNVRYFQSLGYAITGTGKHHGYAEPTFYTMGKVIP
jgi:ribosomal protein S18 acetylase RimI-like enzyme